MNKRQKKKHKKKLGKHSYIAYRIAAIASYIPDTNGTNNIVYIIHSKKADYRPNRIKIKLLTNVKIAPFTNIGNDIIDISFNSIYDNEQVAEHSNHTYGKL